MTLVTAELATSAPPGTEKSDVTTSFERTDVARLEAFLQALARAIRQIHTYPPVSPRCVSAIEDCHRALASVPADVITCVVTPHELLVSGTPIGRDTLVEQELARRLHDHRCQALDIDRSATPRDLSTFCVELVAGRHDDAAPLSDRLRGHGVERVSVRAGYQTEVFDVAASATVCAAIERDRQWRDAQPSSGRVTHLYPADKGWIRIDPGAALRQVTLPALAVLVEDPAALAQMLSKVGGDTEAKPLSRDDALEERCGDVARLYAALAPATARGRFARLATAVLALDTQQRQRLLKKTVLPALIDGYPEGELIRELPDVDLADALSLLLDVETAAPELLATALDRLNLPAERRDALAPLLEERIEAQQGGRQGPLHDNAVLRERTLQLIRVAHGETTFDGFAAFDLSIDRAAEEAIARTGGLIAATNLVDAQLSCVSHLIALNPHPNTASPLLREATRLLGELERTEAWSALADRLTALQRTAHAVRESQPAIAETITAIIRSFYTPGRFARLVTMYVGGGEQRAIATRLVEAAGADLTGAVIKALQDRPGDTLVLQLVSDHAAVFAPTLAASLHDLPVTQRIPAIRALSATGRGSEQALARQLSHESDAVARETLHALARVGSREAAELVTRYLLRKGSAASLAAEEAVWQFSPATTRQCLRTLLRNRQFVLDNPELTLRLLERTDCFEPARIADVLAPLRSLRFRLWNPRSARIGRRAVVLLQS
jgi:hypothetical protein